MRFLTILLFLFFQISLFAQPHIKDAINHYGKFDEWSVRAVEESALLGGNTRYLYEFYGDQDTTYTQEPYKAPRGYYWRTNNVMAVISGIRKTNTTIFPEKRGDGYCARIETLIVKVKALGIINMEVVCQGAMILGALNEPIRSTSDPFANVHCGIPYTGRPTALTFDYKAIVGNSVIKGTGFGSLKDQNYPDYAVIGVVLQKRWEDKDGNVYAQRVGTGIQRIEENVPQWVNVHKLMINYGDISKEPYYKDYMKLYTDPERTYHTKNSKGEVVPVVENGWAAKDVQPNTLLIWFYTSCEDAFYGGVGNKLWLDNVHLD